MQLSIQSTIPFPISKVYEAMRDHLPELAQYMPNIESIEVKSGWKKNDKLQLVNQWNPAEHKYLLLLSLLSKRIRFLDRLCNLDRFRLFMCLAFGDGIHHQGGKRVLVEPTLSN